MIAESFFQNKNHFSINKIFQYIFIMIYFILINKIFMHHFTN